MLNFLNFFQSCLPSYDSPKLVLPPYSSNQEFSDNIILKIFSFLSPSDLSIAQQVCRKWQKLSNNDKLWCKLYQAHYPSAVTENKMHFKTIFKLRRRGEEQFKQAADFLNQIKKSKE